MTIGSAPLGTLPLASQPSAGGAVNNSVVLSPATYTLTAASLAAKTNRLATLSGATYTLTAASLANVLSRKATLSAATYNLSASSLAALTGRFAVLSPASYVLTASNLGASVGHPTTLSAASYSLSASNLATLVTRNVALSRATFTFTGASLDAVYTPGAGAVNYTATLSPASYAYSGVSLTVATSIVVTPEPPATVPGGGGGGVNVFYRGRRRYEVRKAIERSLRELAETKTTRARKRKARRVSHEIVAAFNIDFALLQLPVSAPEQFVPLEQARQAVFELAAQLSTQERASAESARQLEELFLQYQAEAKRLDQREEEEAMAIILAVAA